MTGLVLRVSGWEILIADETADPGPDRLCQLRGKVKAGPRRAGAQVVAGDRVEWNPTEEGRGIIEAILPDGSSIRENCLYDSPVTTIDRLGET